MDCKHALCCVEKIQDVEFQPFYQILNAKLNKVV